MFPNPFCYLTGLDILNKFGKRKLTGLRSSCTLTQYILSLSLKKSSVNSFLTVKVDKCGKNKHDAISRSKISSRFAYFAWSMCWGNVSIESDLRCISH